jgi:hypothetical protein
MWKRSESLSEWCGIWAAESSASTVFFVFKGRDLLSTLKVSVGVSFVFTWGASFIVIVSSWRSCWGRKDPVWDWMKWVLDFKEIEKWRNEEMKKEKKKKKKRKKKEKKKKKKRKKKEKKIKKKEKKYKKKEKKKRKKKKEKKKKKKKK